MKVLLRHVKRVGQTPIGMFIGHWSSYFIMISCLISFAGIIGELVTDGAARESDSGDSFGGIIIGVVVSYFFIVHDRSSCQHCCKHLLRNDSDLAERRVKILKLHHLSPLLIIALALFAILPTMLISGSENHVMLIVNAWLFLHVYAHTVHRRLSLWCPYCGKGGRDDDDELNEPTGPPALWKQPA